MDRAHSGGGSVSLIVLIDKVGEAILYDFQHYLNLNLVECLRGDDYSPVQLISLIRNLPLESRTVAALRGGEQFLGWGVDRYLMAQLIDSVNSTAYAVVASNSKRKPKAPKPIRRPKKNTQKGENNPFRQRLQMAKKIKEG